LLVEQPLLLLLLLVEHPVLLLLLVEQPVLLLLLVEQPVLLLLVKQPILLLLLEQPVLQMGCEQGGDVRHTIRLNHHLGLPASPPVLVAGHTEKDPVQSVLAWQLNLHKPSCCLLLLLLPLF
jgi:hypothetical protein